MIVNVVIGTHACCAASYTPEYMRWIDLADHYPEGDFTMLTWAIIFAVIAVVAGVLGFGGVASGAAGIAKTLFFLFIAIAVILFILSVLGIGAVAL